MVSAVLYSLFLMPSILLPARTTVAGETISRRPTPTAAAAPATAAPARNLRRFKYAFFAVISDEAMSLAFLISMKPPPSPRNTVRIDPGYIHLQPNRTQMIQKSCMGRKPGGETGGVTPEHRALCATNVAV